MGFFPSGTSDMNPLLAIFIYSTCLALFCSQTGAIHSGWNETDKLALLAFKAKITEDPFGIMRSWNDTTHFCRWYGVTCGSRHQRVTQLNLLSLKLGGSISPYIGNLSFLHVLRLYNNNLIQHIPQEIGGLKRLQVLNLMNNTLGGEIPLNLSRCLNLRSLTLSNNMLGGQIPVEISLLPKLEILAASKNNLVGTLPLSLGNLTHLQRLMLTNNFLTGLVPNTLGSLSQLIDLGIGINSLYGEVPSSLFNMSSLERIEIGSNQISGRLPPNMFRNLPNLVYFSVRKNQFIGSIPVSLSNASNMELLQLDENKFEGKVPSLVNLRGLFSFSVSFNQLGSSGRGQDELSFLCSLTNANSLILLQMNDNNFGGKFPECITNLSSKLQNMAIHNNHIFGSIPRGIDNLIGLQALSISNNSFTGIIPRTIGNLNNLAILYLDTNHLSGLIPTSLGKLSRLFSLDLSSNSLEGTIPPILQNCTSLQGLSLSYNNLSGSIPTQLLIVPSLLISLLVSHNQLTGSLPEEVGKLTNINMLDVSGNKLSGRIPDSLGECTSMESLVLYRNVFQGPIPSSWSSMRGLRVLDLAYNNLSGQIPEFLASFKDLIGLNLSFNDLQGSVPKTGVFTNATVTSLQGNKRLCGGIPQFHLPECRSSNDGKNRKLSLKIKAIITIIAGLGCVGLLILLWWVFRMKRKLRKSQEGVVECSEHLPLPFVSYGDIYRATNGFSEENMIGMGNFGRVYKGIFREGEQFVAIKVLKLESLGASKSFVAECQALRNIRHKNLVKLLTVCSGVDYQGNEFKALVYEFMSNGSLEDWLHPPSPVTKQGAISPRKLSLLKRLNIAIDIASLLEYVHHDFGTPLVHCDIKPSNILIDGDISGRLGDFGLAKFLSESGIIRASVQPSSSTTVIGTVGYAPPEYGLGGQVSTQGDVYSFGIVLLEMFTGRRPTDEMFNNGMTLHLYAKTALASGVVEILDPVIQVHLETEEQVLFNSRKSGRIIESLVSVVETGVACSFESPIERMNMRMVTLQLHKIRDNLATKLN